MENKENVNEQKVQKKRLRNCLALMEIKSTFDFCSSRISLSNFVKAANGWKKHLRVLFPTQIAKSPRRHGSSQFSTRSKCTTNLGYLFLGAKNEPSERWLGTGMKLQTVQLGLHYLKIYFLPWVYSARRDQVALLIKGAKSRIQSPRWTTLWKKAPRQAAIIAKDLPRHHLSCTAPRA